MKSLIILSLSIGFMSCTTPRNWGANAHQEMLITCRAACKPYPLNYEPLTGNCQCLIKESNNVKNLPAVPE